MAALQTLKQDFLNYLEIEKNRSQKTIANYDFYLKRFLEWAKITEPRAITQDLVKRYRLYLNRLEDHDGTPLKKNTQNYHVIALRSFLKYLAKQNISTLPGDQVELAKQPEREVTFLDHKDLEQLLDAPLRTQEPEMIQKRDHAILELLFSTGLRVSELCHLTIEKVNLQKDEFTVRGKGDKLRIVFLSPQAKETLKRYLDDRRDLSPSLFVRHDRAAAHQRMPEALTPRSVQRLIQRYAKIAGITKHVTPHTIRHSYATDLLMNGADIRSVQVMLGHASITTTQIYTHITNQQLRDVHKAFHARRRGESDMDED